MEYEPFLSPRRDDASRLREPTVGSVNELCCIPPYQNRYGGRNTPRSVMIAEMSAAGVTSKAGLKMGEASGAVA